MGPTNVALVKLFQADQALREAQARLDAAARNVRIQERRTNDLAQQLTAAQQSLRQQQSKAAQFDLDLKSRDAHIEKLRTQQQTAHNNKEYQAFLVEIATAKVDRNKIEDEAVQLMEAVEKVQRENAALASHVESERAKLAEMSAQITDELARLKGEVDALRPAREAAAAALPPRAREAFDRLAEHHDGEAMSAVAKPDRRREEYLCSVCNMNLVTDVYNKLHTRDELVFCPSCRRILYIPDDLPPELAIHSRGTAKSADESERTTATPARKPPKVRTEKAAEPSAKGKLGQLLTAAQGESVKGAKDADTNPLPFEVIVDGKSAGAYKGKSREHLERVIRFRMEQAKLTGEVQVIEKPQPAAAEVTSAMNSGTATDSVPAARSLAPEPTALPEVPSSVSTDSTSGTRDANADLPGAALQNAAVDSDSAEPASPSDEEAPPTPGM